MRVYLLSTYGEHGAEDVRATLDPSYLPVMLEKYFSDAEWAKHPERRDAASKEAHEGLRRGLLEDGEPSSEGRNLQDGWGGIQLHIIEVERSA